MRRAAVALLCLAAAGAEAQTVQPPGSAVPPPAVAAMPVLAVDQEALYAGSAWGRRAGAEFARQGRDLQAENERIAAELEREDAALTGLRRTLPADEFRARADAFDARVQQLRRDREAAGRALIDAADADRVRFLERALPVFTALMAERGAVVILDRRTAFLVADGADVTAEMISRIDAALGDGVVGTRGGGSATSGPAGPGEVAGPGSASEANGGGQETGAGSIGSSSAGSPEGPSGLLRGDALRGATPVAPADDGAGVAGLQMAPIQAPDEAGGGPPIDADRGSAEDDRSGVSGPSFQEGGASGSDAPSAARPGAPGIDAAPAVILPIMPPAAAPAGAAPAPGTARGSLPSSP